MTGQLFSFEWRVHSCGYRWIKACGNGEYQWESPPPEYFYSDEIREDLKSDARDGLTQGYYVVTSDDVSNTKLKILDNFENHPTLFLSYSQNPLNSDAVIDFANKWGFLTEGSFEKSLDVPSPDNDCQNILVHAEHASIWAMTHWNLKPMTDTWSLIQKGDLDSIEKWSRQFLGDLLLTVPNIIQIKKEELDEFIDRMIEQEGAVEFANFNLQELINANISGNLTSNVRRDPKTNTWQLIVVPKNLISMLYLQLTQAITGGSEFRRCVVCTDWMEISPAGGRIDKMYCSDACRMRAYRKRKSSPATTEG